MTEYATVVADPPWSPSLGSTWRTARTDKARPQKHYATLTVAEIVDLRPPDCFYYDTAEEAAAAAVRTYGANSGHIVVGVVNPPGVQS